MYRLSRLGEPNGSTLPRPPKGGGYTFRGVSLPSGEVGGDLIDVVADSRGWTALLADVSGYGVGAGVLMAQIEKRLLAAVRAHGPQIDDRTVLLVRRL